MHLVALLQPAQDRDRVRHRRLAHHHRLEATLQRRVLLDVLAVLVQGGRAHAAQFPAREHRLQQVRRVDRAFRGARAYNRVQLVEEQDHAALRLRHVIKHRLQTVLELAPVLRARDQRAHVKRDHAPVAQRLRHVARDDPLRQPLHDRRLANARLANQHGVVLCASRQHLDHPADLLVAPDHRVELALLGRLREVGAEALQRLVLLLRRLVGHTVRAAHLRQRLQQAIARRADARQGPAGDAVLSRERQQQVLGRDVLV